MTFKTSPYNEGNKIGKACVKCGRHTRKHPTLCSSCRYDDAYKKSYAKRKQKKLDELKTDEPK